MPPIEFLPAERVFLLHGPAFTYALRALPAGHLAHLYWGPRLRSAAGLVGMRPDTHRAVTSNPDPDGPRVFSLDLLSQEFPVAGASDRRLPALVVTRLQDGSRTLDLRYAGHAITPGKPRLDGLPATYVEDPAEAQTLRVDLVDAPTGLRVELRYTVFRDHDVLARSVRLVNGGGETLDVERLLSASVDLPETVGAGGYRMLQLSGAWARERHVHDTPLRPGVQAIESRRGASSHAQNPFLALLAPEADESHGHVFGFSLVYSGDFLAAVDVEPYGTARAAIGIHPETFGWRLGPGETFQAPEGVLAFSANGLGPLSRTYHRLYRDRLCRGTWRDRPRPVLINNWEATYFTFDADRIERLAGAAADLGIELFVLDDGWFGHRNDDTTSLGDWTTDLRKLPGGLDDLARRVNATGMQFGLWFEPEMVSRDSDLFRAHPDWHLHAPGGRYASESRNQLILDLSRPEVCEHIHDAVAAVLRSAPIAYVKWDMNRNFSEVGSPALPPERQREVPHRYILGLYEVLERLTAEFPQVLFESCSGGGGRFDPGMLFYMPQVWTSDNTDAVERLAIQHGTSLVYPLSTMGAHVSAVPNHQVGRVTPVETRGHVALFGGGFGYELDLHQLTDAERAEIREQVAMVKELRPLVRDGEFHRLVSPFAGDGGETAWMVVAPDRREALLLYVRVLVRPNGKLRRLVLRGLDPARDYRCERLDDAGKTTAAESSLPGDLLMGPGLLLPLGGIGGTPDGKSGDFRSYLWRLRANV